MSSPEENGPIIFLTDIRDLAGICLRRHRSRVDSNSDVTETLELRPGTARTLELLDPLLQLPGRRLASHVIPRTVRPSLYRQTQWKVSLFSSVEGFRKSLYPLQFVSASSPKFLEAKTSHSYFYISLKFYDFHLAANRTALICTF